MSCIIPTVAERQLNSDTIVLLTPSTTPKKTNGRDQFTRHFLCWVFKQVVGEWLNGVYHSNQDLLRHLIGYAFFKNYMYKEKYEPFSCPSSRTSPQCVCTSINLFLKEFTHTRNYLIDIRRSIFLLMLHLHVPLKNIKWRVVVYKCVQRPNIPLLAFSRVPLAWFVHAHPQSHSI